MKIAVLPEVDECVVGDCDAEVYYRARGYCGKHYYRWKRHGDPLVTKRIVTSGTPHERLLARATVTDSGCLVVDGPLSKAGYAQIGGKKGEPRLYGHRIEWELVHGPIPDSLTIDHLCRVRNCINVEHMELVIQPVNASRAKRPDQAKCGRGLHDWVPENIYEWTRREGRVMRSCRQCRGETRNAWQRVARAKRKAGE